MSLRSGELITAGLLLAIAWLGVVRTTAADDAAVLPRWIWASRTRPAGETALFQRRFDCERPAVRARLRADVDFADLMIYLNGQRIADVEDYGPVVAIDVTSHVKPGRNLIAARAIGSSGPAAILIQCDIEFADGETDHIVTSERWLSTTHQHADWHEADFRPQNWDHAASFGEVAAEMWGDPGRDIAVSELDDYTQWKQALNGDSGADPSTFLLRPGFEIELLRSALSDEGSWISLAFDPRGRLTIAKEQRGLLRMTLPSGGGEIQVETIDDTLQECRGLLYAYDSLFVNANNSKGLYRLRDTDGDDRFDETKILYASTGGVGHGRNDLALGPDGMIYSIHGDSVDLPTEDFLDFTSPLREARRGAKTQEGHVIRMDRDGGNKQLVAAGLRNPFGIDFNRHGDMFTYDADAEYDMGSPWYRPTRIVHLIEGADYGWRGVTGQWPPYYPDHPDNGIPTLDIGRGSPTAVKFGTQSSFAPPYRDALFVLDWAYGRILAVHMELRGASYRGRAETFLRGRPLNVTDLDFGPDGAMYFVTGGRKTQSALYRVRYTGPELKPAELTRQQIQRNAFSLLARGERLDVASFPPRDPSYPVDRAWLRIDNVDPWVRQVARLGVERQPWADWKDRLRVRKAQSVAAEEILAMARSGERESLVRVVWLLNGRRFATQLTRHKVTELYAYELSIGALDKIKDEVLLEQCRHKLEAAFPDPSPVVNQRLASLLVRLDSAVVVPRTLELLAATTSQPEQLHYLFALRDARRGWTPELRQVYFEWLGRMDDFQGGEGMPKFRAQIRADALTALNDSDREKYAALLAAAPVTDDAPLTIDRPLVKQWQPADFEDVLNDVAAPRNFDRGQATFAAALCIRCHRVGRDGTAVGPDLTSVSSRFSRRDILAAILLPSNVVAENYRTDVVVTKDGRVLTGRIVPQADYRAPELLIAADPLRPAVITRVPKSEIESSDKSPVSIMPQGLLDSFTKDEVLDLLAFLASGGERNDGGLQK